MIKQILLIPIVFLFIITPLVSADTSLPENQLKTVIDQIISILNDPDLQDTSKSKERRELLFDTAITIFDYEKIARGALGSNWRRFSADQRTRFTSYFSKLIADSYFSRMNGKTFENIRIEYVKTDHLPPTKSGIERADVFTEIHRETLVTPVDYRMLKNRSGAWRIYDVKIEGVSMVSNYRQQYRKRFNDTPEQLIQELKGKVEQ